jgi:small subunit ribosomal protein S16
MGRRHKPFFRLNAIESRNPRDGRIIEKLGHYDPIEKKPEKQLVLNKERIEYWLSVGAVPSETAAQLIAKIGIVSKHYQQGKAQRKRAKLSARKKGVLFDTTQRLQAKKITEKAETEGKAKAEAEVKAKAETEAKAKAEAEAEAKAEAEVKAKAETEAKAKAETEAKAKAEAEAKAETKAKAETETKAETKAKAEPKTKAKAKAASKQKSPE